MSSRPRLWMPFYWGDYIADTQHLSTFQHGAYLLLIAAYWCNGGPIPSDPAYLARVVRCSRDKVARYLNPVLAMFTCDGSLLHHKRIDNELLRSSDRQAAAIANGRAGGLAKSKLSITITTKKEEISSSMLNGHTKDFDDFWEVYPRKEGREQAAAAFLQALSRSAPEMLINCARAYATRMVGTEPKFIKMPNNWLSNGSWADDVPEIPPTPEEIEANKDRADKLFHRGKYQVRYE